LLRARGPSLERDFTIRSTAALRAGEYRMITMFHKIVAALVLGIVPQLPLVSDRVDVLELNRVYDDQGRPVLTQMIFWDWHQRDARLHVVAWRLWKDESQQPLRDWSQGDFVLLWNDGELLREVRAKTWRESWTQFDPELQDRNTFAKEHRRGLSHDEIMPGAKWTTDSATP
jgi:hypothetical protein